MTLPVGLDLTGRRALVVGGGPAVVDGVRALVGAGALVHVVSPWLCEELEELAVAGGLAWSRTRLRRAGRPRRRLVRRRRLG